MPSLTESTGTKFQLPALDLKFGSLTEGTDIPPPPPSPKHEDLQPTPVAELAKFTAINNGTQTTPEVQRNGLKSPVDQPPSGSPLLSKGEHMFPRPVSQSNASIATDGQPKRASAWFRRLRGSDGLESRRSSKIFVSPAENTKPLPATMPKVSGPPPPMIPEFKSLGSKVDLGDDGGSLGSDLFKDIK
ncbi:unnamed protein product [Discula destructiva]